MSKQIKQMEMVSLKNTFENVRDMVVLSVSGVPSQADNQMRLTLRKKNIRMQVVKNSLANRVFEQLGMKVTGYWSGPTLVAWGSNSLSELSKEIETFVKKLPKIQVKGAISEGQEVTFKQALAMPTKPEAIGRVISLALSPASRLVGQILGPASRVASQIKTLSEKAPPEEAAASEPAPAG